MATKKGAKKYFSAGEANAALPLVRAIVRDITALAEDLRERHERLGLVPPEKGAVGDAHREEWKQMQEALERDQERLQEYEQELQKLGVYLKDYQVGLVDFPCWMDGREVYPCWKLDEPEVAHWHEVNAGFSGRQKLTAAAAHGR